MRYTYHPQVLEQLARHGVRPTPATPPKFVHEFIRDLYRFEIRRLRRRHVVEGRIDRRDYAAHVVALRRKYILLSVPLGRWTDAGQPSG